MTTGRPVGRPPQLPALTVGQVFSRWTVVAFAGRLNGRKMWACRCSCGTSKHVEEHNLRRGQSVSCGCLPKERLIFSNTTHGHCGTKTPTYNSWRAMRDRCTQPSHVGWKNYGGRGIKVCPRWMRSYEYFLADMGLRPDGHTLHRINNDKGYNKANCKWATPVEQAREQRRYAAA